MVEKTQNYAVKDMKLAKEGHNLIHWAEDHMPVLMRIRNKFEEKKPLKELTIGCCLHVTKETAVLMKTLKVGGAKVTLCASNPLSTNDAVAAALAKEGILVYAWRGVSNKEYYWCVDKVLDHKPNITMDDGGDLVTQLHTKRKKELQYVIAGTEETTTGVNRQRIMAEKGDLMYPIIAVNDRKVNIDSVIKAIKIKFPNMYKQKILNIVDAGNLFYAQIETAGGLSDIYYHSKGIEINEVDSLLQKICIDSKLPECIRIAHLIGRIF